MVIIKEFDDDERPDEEKSKKRFKFDDDERPDEEKSKKRFEFDDDERPDEEKSKKRFEFDDDEHPNEEKLKKRLKLQDDYQSLPGVILESIIMRLAITKIWELRRLNKEWKQIITGNECLIGQRLPYKDTSDHTLYSVFPLNNPDFRMYVKKSLLDDDSMVIPLSNLPFVNQLPNFTVVGSSSGFLLVWDETRGALAIVNPVIGDLEYVPAVPNYDCSWSSEVFGFGSAITPTDFKLLIVIRNKERAIRYIHSLLVSDYSWMSVKRMRTLVDIRGSCGSSTSVCIQNFFYWFILENSTITGVEYLNFETQETGLCSPLLIYVPNNSYLGDIGGRLTIGISSEGLDLWQMEVNGIWRLAFHIVNPDSEKGSSCYMQPLGISSDHIIPEYHHGRTDEILFRFIPEENVLVKIDIDLPHSRSFFWLSMPHFVAMEDLLFT